MSEYPVRYPRFRIRRGISRLLLRILLPLVFDIRITGREHLRGRTPALLAGNHSGILEILIMIAYGPKGLELLGSGDVPMSPSYRSLTRFYDFIPVNRGNMDRNAYHSSVAVLQQGGHLGIFPEGGIWEAQRGAAQKGVSWIAMQAQVPVIPIGVGGLHDVAGTLKRLRRPLLTVGVGQPIPPLPAVRGPGRKEALNEHAEQVMNEIMNVIPEYHRKSLDRPLYERFSLDVRTEDGKDLNALVPDGDALALLLFKPVLIRTFRINLKMNVGALETLEALPTGADIGEAAHAVLAYLSINPHFFNYRFGAETGSRIRDSFIELEKLAAAHREDRLRITATRVYMPNDESGELEETIPKPAA